MIVQKPIEFFIAKLKANKTFSMVGYSDAEWFSVLKYRIGDTTGLGQLIDTKTGDRLREVLVRRANEPKFLFAVPNCLWEISCYVGNSIGPQIEEVIKDLGITFYERDMLTDTLAEQANLYPFIHQLQQMDTVVIGPEQLRGLDFLGYKHFIEISTPNLHMEHNGIENTVQRVMDYGKPAVYLVSAGVSAAITIDALHNKIPSSFFIDCGSIWDAFVGIGGQREWRRKLYSNPEALAKWRSDNLNGKSRD